MNRRSALRLLTGAALSGPFAARAQQTAMPTIGYLCGAAAAEWGEFLAAFRDGLASTGYVEGRNVAIEFRWADGQYDRLSAMAVELARRQVALIVATGGAAAALAARKASAVIPIVFANGDDPVALGLVASLGRPGGNVTGVTFFSVSLMAKRVELLHDILPAASTIAVLINAESPSGAAFVKETRRAARAMRQQVEVFRVRQPREIDAALASMQQARIGALIVAPDPLFQLQRDRLVALSARHSVPTVYAFREFATAGGLMSYGSSRPDAYRSVGVYAGRILGGAKPAELPVLQPTTFELAINMKTAKALGLAVPPSLLMRADEVIQ